MNSNNYVLLQGVCFYGGDISDFKGLTYAKGIETAKQFINGDPSRCVTLKRQNNGSYSAYCKNMLKTNPSAAKDHNRVTIVYGSPI